MGEPVSADGLKERRRGEAKLTLISDLKGEREGKYPEQGHQARGEHERRSWRPAR